MKRKLVKQGAATLMVSLPSKWLRKFSLGKGDEIDVEETEDSLIMTKEGPESKKEAEITLTKEVETGLRTMLVNTYRAGYDLVKVNYSSESQFEAVKKAIKGYVLGYDITKREKGCCIIESITDPSPEQFDAIMNKIFFSIKEIIAITKERLSGKKVYDSYEEIGLRIHQYSSFCRRIVSKRKKDVKDPNLFWTFQTLLVHGQRDLYHLNRFLDKNQIKASKETISFLDEILEMVELIAKAYSKKETTHLEQVHEDEKELIYKKGHSMLSSKKGKENIAVYYLMSSARNFYLASSPLMGLLLE